MKIVIAVDGSEAARKALLSGLARAEGNKSVEIHVIAVATGLPPRTGSDKDLSLPALEKSLFEAASEMLLTYYKDICDHHKVVPAKMKALKGDASSAICDYAASVHANLIIVGHQNRKGSATGFSQGSVSKKVAEHATCSVLLVKRDHGEKVPEE